MADGCDFRALVFPWAASCVEIALPVSTVRLKHTIKVPRFIKAS